MIGIILIKIYVGFPPPKQIFANLLLFNSSIISISVNWCDIRDEGYFFWILSSSFFSSRIEYVSLYINKRINGLIKKVLK
jgi:hypothetical protein